MSKYGRYPYKYGLNKYKFYHFNKKYNINPIQRILHNIKHVSKYGRLLESGYTDMETWGALQKCWIGFNISRSRIDLKNQIMYAERIQKLQKELGIEITNFANIGVYAADVYDEDDDQNNESAEINQEISQDDDQCNYDNRDVLRDDDPLSEENQDVLRDDDPLSEENQDVLRDDGVF
ncbi:MAG: hypothetical protein MRJ93_11935 [Nitrososphaeraceae archaeon]|nr:hypothetical protein [Nitrososphaeraceae archaeon]